MSERLHAELARVAELLGGGVEFTLERPRDPSHGDLATNLAMQLARRDRTNPRAMAQRVVDLLDAAPGFLAGVEIAGPGFINFRLAPDTIAADFAALLAAGDRFGRSESGRGRRVNVEFVSANPTGPLHVGHGRGAALGDAIGSLLQWTGHDVTREFYVNDAGVQIARLAESVWARVQQAAGRDAVIPEGGYHGEYLRDTAGALLAGHGAGFADVAPETGIAAARAAVLGTQRREQDSTLADFGVRFDVISSEQAVYDRGEVEAALDRFAAAGLTFTEGGALWLRTTAFGDDRDRVLRKSDGTYTYLAPDIGYHLGKYQRGFDRAIDVWGADHHGYVARMQAALTALGVPAGWLDVVLVQLVRVVRGGEEVKMSKRSGDFVTLRDLYEEVGVDAARYWFMMRRADSHLVFDIDLAKSRTDENPVFYVQMAHARMSGILRNAGNTTGERGGEINLAALAEPDLDLIKALLRFPALVEHAAGEHAPHRITAYCEELARQTHAWYHVSRVIGEAPAVERARLLLAGAVRQVFANALAILGIAAPDRM